MNASERRAHILSRLNKSEQAVSASVLAGECGVSRQIIVGDIALLRAAGETIIATPHGYVMKAKEEGLVCQIACAHGADDMTQELLTIVDQGCTVMDVIVAHPVYGELAGSLNLSSRYDVQTFIDKVAQASAQPISMLTDGVHLHTLRCPDEAACARVRQALRDLGMLLEDEG